MRNFLLKVISNFSVFLILVFLLLFGLWGVKPTEAIFTANVGYFRLTTFIKGFALYQQGMPFFYNFSPYDDYFIDREGSYKPLITKKDIIDEKFEVIISQKPVKKRLSYLLGLYGLFQPEISYKSNLQKIHYFSDIKENTIKIKRQISGPPLVNETQAVGMTISFNDQDFVFDQNYHLYTGNITGDLEAIEKYFGLRLIPMEKEEKNYNLGWCEIPGQNVFILNPSLPGVIQLKAQSNQKIMFNKTYNLLAMEEKGNFDGGKIESFMMVKILKDIDEIIEGND